MTPLDELIARNAQSQTPSGNTPLENTKVSPNP